MLKDEIPRRHTRHRCDGEITMRHLGADGSTRGRLINMGGGGARIAVEEAVPKGTVLSLTLREGGRDRKILGRVASSDHEEIGIEFGWDVRDEPIHQAKPTPRFLSWFRRANQ